MLQVSIDALLNQWRDDALLTLKARVERLFDASAEVMLEYAEKAQNDHIRGRFYEALRELHLNDNRVREHFIAGLSRTLFRFDDTRGPEPPGRDDVMRLVDPEDYERGLALQLIAEHAERDHSALFHSLSLRLAAISGRKPIPPGDIPAGPRQITAQFAASSTLLHIEHEARLALYTLFERFVMPASLESLTRLDTLLIDAGVLPDLAPRLAPSAKPARATEPSDAPAAKDDSAEQAAPEGSGQQLGDEVLLRIRDLLSARRARQRPPGAAHHPPAPPAPMGEVIAAISELPGSPAPPPIPGAQVATTADVSPEDLKDVRQSLFAQRARVRQQLGEERISPDIDDVIEIVGALFEMMLNEENLPDAAKALLSHLHTPYLKYAVADPGVLEDPAHPARHWFDDMVRTGSEWVDPADLKLGLYPWMSDAVLRVTTTKQISKSLFEELQQALAAQVQTRSKKQQGMEKRAGEHARGKALLDQAQDLAQDELDLLLADHPGGHIAADFLEDTWINYLVLLLLRSNNDINSTTVKEALALGQSICDVCDRSARGDPAAGQKVQNLEKTLEVTISHLIPHVKPSVKAFITSLKTNSLPVNINDIKTKQPKRQNIRQRKNARSELTKQEQKIAASLTKLPSGTRLWRQSEDNQNPMTIRLVWFNPQTLHFMFANLAGQNAGMVSIKELASDIAQGRARVLEEHSESFFEKALRSFQALLKQGL